MVSNKSNWLSPLKQTLTEHGFKEVWDNRGTLNERKFLIDLKSTLHNHYSKSWFDELNINSSDSKLRTYSQFKQDFQTENYLINFNNFEKRKYFTKLRISSHDLQTDTTNHRKHLLRKEFAPIVICKI